MEIAVENGKIFNKTTMGERLERIGEVKRPRNVATFSCCTKLAYKKTCCCDAM